MTETIMPPEILANLKVCPITRHYISKRSLYRVCVRVQPEFVAPFVLAVTHPSAPDASGKIFEVGAGFIAEIHWERSKGVVFKTDASFTPSTVRKVSKHI